MAVLRTSGMGGSARGDPVGGQELGVTTDDARDNPRDDAGDVVQIAAPAFPPHVIALALKAPVRSMAVTIPTAGCGEQNERNEQTRREIAAALHAAADLGVTPQFVSSRRLRQILTRHFSTPKDRAESEQIKRFRPEEKQVRLCALLCCPPHYPLLYVAQDALDVAAGFARKLVDDPPLDMVLDAAAALPGAIMEAISMAGLQANALAAPLFVGCIGMSWYLGKVQTRTSCDARGAEMDDSVEAATEVG